MKKITIERAMLAMFCLGVLGLGFVVYLIFCDYNVITFNDLNPPTDKLVYHRGETIYYKLDGCKHKDLVGRVDSSLQDGTLIAFPPRPTAAFTNTGCQVKYALVGTIPDYAPLGNYTATIKVTYQPNAFKTVVYTLNTRGFEIQ
jgi:hypothetical protein